MEQNPQSEDIITIDLRQYLVVLWQWAWLILSAAVIAGLIAFFVSQAQPPVYEATATLLINEAPGAGGSNEYNAILTSERLARTYSEMLTKRPVLDEVAERLGITINMEAVEDGAITVQIVRDTQLIDIVVEENDPEMAAAIANTVMQVFSEQNQALQSSRFAESIVNLETQLDRIDGQIMETTAALDDLPNIRINDAERLRLETELQQLRSSYAELLQSYESVRVAEAQATSNVILFDPAVPPESPVRPRVLLNTLLAAMVSGMVAVGIIFLVQAMDDTVKSPEDVKRHLGLPIFGVIPTYNTNDPGPITASSPRSPISDAYRFLRANIHFAGVDFPLRRLLITSASPSEGKSTLAVNLGVVFAQHDIPTLIIDTDFRRPNISKLLDKPNNRGLSDLFTAPDITLRGAVRAYPTPNLSYITTGPTPPNPTELLGSRKMRQILDELSQNVEMVIVDTPPMMVVADAAVLSALTDGVLIVVQPGMTKIAAAKQTLEQLRNAKANVLGVVMVNVDVRRDRYYYGGYYQAYNAYYQGQESGS